MKNKTATVALVALFVLSACAAKTIRVSTPITALQYNDIASRYMERPTFVEVWKISGDNDRLVVSMSGYGIGADAQQYVHFERKHIPKYISLIDKYLKWEEIAKSRGDMIDKTIGDAATFTGAYIRFSFHSANNSSHLLIVEMCSLGSCPGRVMQAYNRKNALLLRQLLVDFQQNKIRQPDESLYQ